MFDKKQVEIIEDCGARNRNRTEMKGISIKSRTQCRILLLDEFCEEAEKEERRRICCRKRKVFKFAILKLLDIFLTLTKRKYFYKINQSRRMNN